MSYYCLLVVQKNQNMLHFSLSSALNQSCFVLFMTNRITVRLVFRWRLIFSLLMWIIKIEIHHALVCCQTRIWWWLYLSFPLSFRSVFILWWRAVIISQFSSLIIDSWPHRSHASSNVFRMLLLFHDSFIFVKKAAQVRDGLVDRLILVMILLWKHLTAYLLLIWILTVILMVWILMQWSECMLLVVMKVHLTETLHLLAHHGRMAIIQLWIVLPEST